MTNFKFWDSEDAYKKAIEECIEKGILADYLKRKGSEVVNMLIAEYDYDLDIEVQREEAYESGLEDGRVWDMIKWGGSLLPPYSTIARRKGKLLKKHFPRV